jgi:hypothetical protein
LTYVDSNYTIQKANEVIVVGSGVEISLPDTPEIGQEHLIGATTMAVEILGGVHPIESGDFSLAPGTSDHMAFGPGGKWFRGSTGSIILAGDVIGPSDDNEAIALTGIGGSTLIRATSPNVRWDAATLLPRLTQDVSTTGAGQPFTVVTQAALAGSAMRGGDMYFVLGKPDDPNVEANSFHFCVANEFEPLPPVTGGGTLGAGNMDEIMQVWKGPGGVAHISLAPGSGVGWGGVQLASTVLVSIASHSTVNLITINGPDTASLYVTNNFNDGADEAAFPFSYTTRHATSGDDAGIQINHSRVLTPGQGQTRWIDVRSRADSVSPFARELDVRPIVGLPGGDVHSDAYLQLSAGAAILGRAPAFNLEGGSSSFTLAGVFGAKIIPDSTTVLHALAGVAAFQIGQDNSTTAATGAKLSVIAQSTSAGGGAGGDLEVGPGAGSGASGNLSLVNTTTTSTVGAAGGASPTPASPSEYLVVKTPAGMRKMALYLT